MGLPENNKTELQSLILYINETLLPIISELTLKVRTLEEKCNGKSISTPKIKFNLNLTDSENEEDTPKKRKKSKPLNRPSKPNSLKKQI